MGAEFKTGGQAGQLPGIAVLAIVLGIMLVPESPFKPTRPAMSEFERVGTEHVRSRLWRDPFAAVHQHNNKFHSNGFADGAKNNKALSDDNPDIAYHLDQVPQRVCNTSSGDDKSLDNVHSIEELRCQIQRDTTVKACDLQVSLASNYSEQKEIIKIFKGSSKPDVKECSVLAVPLLVHSDESTDYAAEWTITGFLGGDFLDKRIVDDDNPELLSGLNEVLINNKLTEEEKSKIADLAFLSLGRSIADLHVLAVMVPGGPYAEDNERRLRNRYAVISGLANTDYLPEDAEHIDYIDFSHRCEHAIRENETNNTQFCDWPGFIPYEWFKLNKLVPDNKMPRRILVLWLDNDAFARNDSLNMLDQLHHLILPKDGENLFDKPGYARIDFNVLGPSNSGTLQRMYDEIVKVGKENLANDKKHYRYLERSVIFSSQAIIDMESIKNQVGLNKEEENDDFNWLRNRIVRPTNTSSELAETLVCELRLRGFAPFSGDGSKQVCDGSLFRPGWWHYPKKQHHVVLIGELDTLYSRNLADSIKEEIEGTVKLTENNEKLEGVHHFDYMRGLDGANANDDLNNSKKNDADDQIRRPVGPNQFDYLRRIADRVSHLDNKLSKGGKGRVKAIGILGNDTYDKLLILQALRGSFPDVLFFTTDLDARLLHSAENDWARNLIVASSYGLLLHEDLQQRAPPFRDSYQTALYLATMMAVKWQAHDCNNELVDNKCDSLETSRPRVFEVGRNGEVDLSHTSEKREERNLKYLGSKVSDIHPERSDSSIFHNVNEKYSILYVVFFALLLMFLLLYLTRFDRLKDIFFIFFLFILFAVFDISGKPWDEEPFSLNNGTSVWPANLVGLLTIILSFYFICKSNEKLKNNSSEIKKQYELKTNGKEGEGTQEKLFMEPWLVNVWKLNIMEPKSVSLDYLWSRYLTLGNATCCAFRVVCMCLAYMLCIYMLFLMGYLAWPSVPYRGVTSSLFSHWIIFVTVMLYFLLVFLVLDITHFNNRFVWLLNNCTVDWPKDLVSRCAKSHGLEDVVASDKILLDLVVKRTTAVDKLVFYPFFVLFLIIISHSYYFDNWQFTAQHFAIIGFIALIAISSVIRLRRTARSVRRNVLKRLHQCYWQSLANEAEQLDNNEDLKASDMSERIKLLIEEIKAIKKGPFLPLSYHPVIQAIALPFGGVGGLYLIEHMATM